MPQLPLVAYQRQVRAQTRDRSQRLQAQRAALPIAQYRDRILEMLRSRQVLILEGGTASGKTTQLPQFIRDEMLAQHAQGLVPKGLIGCVQPR